MTRIIMSSVAAAMLLIAGRPALAQGDVDGRDFLVWQRGGSPAQKSNTIKNAPAQPMRKGNGGDHKETIEIPSHAPSAKAVAKKSSSSGKLIGKPVPKKK